MKIIFRTSGALIIAVVLLFGWTGSRATDSAYENNEGLVYAYVHNVIEVETVIQLWAGTPPSVDDLKKRKNLYNSLGLNGNGGLTSGVGVKRAGAAHNAGGARASSTSGTYTLSSSTPALPFIGNQLVILGTDLFDSNSNFSAVTLRRATDCSLVEDVFEPVNNSLTPASVAELPGAQDYLHSLAGLSTTADAFPNGCTDPTQGTTAVLTTAAVGVTSNNLDLLAQLTGSGLQVQEFNTTTSITTTVLLTSGSSIYAVAVADLNGDGFNDIVASGVTDPGTNQPSFAIFLNNGDGTFAPAKYADAAALATFTIDDMNGDGKPDIIFYNVQFTGGVISSASVTTLVGNGDGTFKPGVNTTNSAISAGGLGSVFITGDFNGDTKKDLIFGGLVLLGNGDGTFNIGPALPATAQAFAANAVSAAAGDFDKDGKLDIAYSGAVSGSGAVQILIGNGDGSFRLGARYASLTPAQQLTVTDIDGDGIPDLVAGNSSHGLYAQDSNDNLSPMLQILPGRGDGTFVGAQVYSGSAVAQLATADFNGDGNADALVFQQSSGPGATLTSLAVLPGDGTGTLGTAISSPVNTSTGLVVAADMNHDGKPDAVVAALGAAGTANASLPLLAVLINQGNGTFAAEQDYVLPNTVTSVAVGDFNGDGHMDVAVGLASQPGAAAGPSGVYVLFGQQNGTLAAAVKIDSSAYPAGIAAGDLNGDGRSDLVVTDQGTNFPGSGGGVNGALHVYLGNANGTLTAAPAPTTTASIYGPVVLADLNKDGKLDLIVGGGAASLSDAPTVYTLLGNGDGTFKTAQVSALSAADDVTPGSIAVADFNGDGMIDVVVGTASDYTEVLLGKGDGTLVDSILALGQQPLALSAVDLNGDTLPELLIGSSSGLAVFLNAPKWQAAAGGSSATTTTLTVAPSPAATAQTVTLTATVTSATSGTPSGTVNFLDGAAVLGSSALNAQGAVSFSSTSLSAGSHSLSAQYGGDSVFAGSISPSVSLVVSAAGPDFSIAISSASASLAPGGSATSQITLTPNAGFNGSVTLSCSGLPNGASCSFAPVSVAVNATPATSTVTISTRAMTAARSVPSGGGTLDPLVPTGSVLAGIAAFPLVRRRQVRRARSGQILLWLLTFVMCGGALALTGCGGGGGGNTSSGGGTAAGTYSVTITATSGSTTHSVVYALTVT